MVRRPHRPPLVNLWVILGGVLVAGGLIIAMALLVMLLPIPTVLSAQPGTALTIIPAPSATPTREKVLETPTPTAPPSIEGISIGAYVQITGTEGTGLRLRSGPGTQNPSRLLGMDAEVFQVKDGPKVADGFTWWFLEAPYDPTRSGWAASKYLQAVQATPESTATP